MNINFYVDMRTMRFIISHRNTHKCARSHKPFSFQCLNSFTIISHVRHFLIIFYFSLEAIIRPKIMSGRILIEWKHRLCSELSRQRYMDPDITRAVHIEIANIFFNQEQDDSDEISSEHNSAGKSLRYNYRCLVAVVADLTVLNGLQTVPSQFRMIDFLFPRTSSHRNENKNPVSLLFISQLTIVLFSLHLMIYRCY